VNPIEELQAILGDAPFRKFLAVFAGTTVTFPKQPRGTFFVTLSRVIGPDPAEQARARFAGEEVYVPMNVAEERARRNDEITARVHAGEPIDAVARAYRTTVRHVRRIACTVARVDLKPRTLA
jgi:hypothetical protein